MTVLVIIISGLVFWLCIDGKKQEDSKPPEYQMSGDGCVYEIFAFVSIVILLLAIINLFM